MKSSGDVKASLKTVKFRFQFTLHPKLPSIRYLIYLMSNFAPYTYHFRNVLIEVNFGQCEGKRSDVSIELKGKQECSLLTKVMR